MLLLGAVFRPRKADVESIAPVAQTDLARLQRLTVRNNVNEIARYFSDIAGNIQNLVLRLPAAGRSGIVWTSDRVATSSGPLRPPEKGQGVGRVGGVVDLSLSRFVPHRPAALYQVKSPEGLATNVHYPAAFYAGGVWAFAAWRDEENQLAYDLGQFLGPATADCDGFTGTQLRLNIRLTPAMLGGGVFDYDGGLMGLIVGCGGAVIALDSATIEASFAAPDQIEDRIAGQFGFAAGALSEEERKALGVEKGVLVRQVWRGYQAALAGLLPGDVIVGLDAKPLNGSADLERMTLPIAREVFDLTVVRGGRERDVRLNARPASRSAFGPGGVAWADSPVGLAIRAVDPGGRLAQAGVRPGDRILRLDGQSAERADDVDRILAQPGKKVYAVFEREGRLWGALI
jgi:membrane-associated protease RseP (regulator of RpoE activity)